MAGRFEGQGVVVTAGGSGIGAAAATRFAQEGAGVVVADLSGKRATAVTARIADAGGKATALKMDASDPDGVQAAIRLALDTYGRLDVMFNNAGHGEPALLEDTSLESWQRTLAVSLTTTFLGIKYSLPVMRDQGKGAIVNTASVSGMGGDYGMAAYNASKAGVINLTRAAGERPPQHPRQLRVSGRDRHARGAVARRRPGRRIPARTGTGSSARTHGSARGGRRDRALSGVRRRGIRHRPGAGGRWRSHRAYRPAGHGEDHRGVTPHPVPWRQARRSCLGSLLEMRYLTLLFFGNCLQDDPGTLSGAQRSR